MYVYLTYIYVHMNIVLRCEHISYQFKKYIIISDNVSQYLSFVVEMMLQVIMTLFLMDKITVFTTFIIPFGQVLP